MEVTFAGSLVADAAVVFLHPVHNVAVVRCDPAVLKQVHPPLRPATLATDKKAELRPGEVLHFVGFDHQNNVFNTEVKVAAVYVPSGRDEFPMLEFCRFRERNLEIAVLADTPEDARGGVLCDANGVVRALFAAYDLEEATEAFGVPVSAFGAVVEELRQNVNSPPKVPSLDLEVNAIDLATLVRGASGPLPEAWLQAVTQRCHRQGQVARAMVVHRVMSTGASDGKLKPGDVLLSIAGQAIASALDMEQIVASRLAPLSDAVGPPAVRASMKRPAASRSRNAPAMPDTHVAVKVYRKGAEVDVEIKPTMLLSQDDGQLVVWSGLVLRRTPRSILERSGDTIIKGLSGIFAQAVLGGSPADARDLRSFWCLLDIDGQSVQTLEDVLLVLEKIRSAAGSESRPWVRLRFVDLNGQEHVGALQCDPLFFPTLELKRADAGRWQCVQH